MRPLHGVSCREETGTELINNIIGTNQCRTVLDPTLMVEKSVWDKLCPESKFKEPYIFVYMLRGTKEQRCMIEKFAKKVNLKIITMPFMEPEYAVWYDFKFGDFKYWDAGPDEFISVIKNASYVFTDSFHSSVFSILYHVPFFTFPKVGKAQMSRIINLQKILNIDSRMVYNENDINCVFQKKIDWKSVDEILDGKRIISQQYIRKVIRKYDEGICL